MKTSELTGAALDWAVAKCEGIAIVALHGNLATFSDPLDDGALNEMPINYSTDWAQGGPIIEREKITLEWTGEDWMGYIRHDEEFFGSTPLIAAMRCYVAYRLGAEVDVPDSIALDSMIYETGDAE